MKTNCNIIKDLLPSYIDELCSSESCQLIQEHLAECTNCKKLYERLQSSSMTTNTANSKEIDYFKKINTTVSRKNIVLVIIVALLLLLQTYCNIISSYQFHSDLFPYLNYVFPVIISGILFAILPDYAEHEVPSKLKFTILGMEFIIMTYVLLLIAYTKHCIQKGTFPLGMEAQQIGPFINTQLSIFAFGFGLTFAATLFLSIRKKMVCPALHFVPLGGLSLMFAYIQFLHQISAPFEQSAILRPYLALGGEVILLVGIYMFVNRKALQ